MSPDSSSEVNKDANRSSKKRRRVTSEKETEKWDSLPWTSSLPDANNADNDSFPLLIGSNELEGGFFGLEEIDEADYGLGIESINLKNGKKKLKGKSKSKKGEISKGDSYDKSVGDAHIGNEDTVEENQEEEKSEVKRKKKKKAKKNKKIDLENNGETNITDRNAEPEDGVSEKDNSNIEENPVDEEEYNAWNELRLHPIIMKSIYRLKFKKPTPVQKACIPAAAHEGKDIIGAAVTGSGKTLAFGLPILQRLLDEREKMERIMGEKGEANERIAPRNVMRALIVTPTRELALQVADHIEEVAKGTGVRVVRIVGGLSKEKHERQLKTRPEIVVGTPGRLWELMSGGETHLVELNYLSFFVLDEADRMIESGHFRELQSIIDMLPKESSDNQMKNTNNCVTVVGRQLKKRQTFVFSATLALSGEFRRKMKRGSATSKKDDFDSIETLSERAGMRANKKIVDLTNPSILAEKLVQSVIECSEEEKDAYLYYILCVHGQGQTIVFCSSIAALRHISAFLSSLSIKVSTLHSEMQQRARLKSMDQFRANEHGVLVATDAAARGLDIPGVRTVVHYQLPHSRDVYVHRCGRTARASTDGCSIALISSNDASSYLEICKSFSKGAANEGFPRFPVEISYMPEIKERSSLAHQIDKIVRKLSKENAEKTWLERNAKLVGLVLEDDDSEEETVKKHKQRKSTKSQLENLKQELKAKLSRPLQQKTLSRRFFTGAGVSPLFQNQLEELGKEKLGNGSEMGPNKKRNLMVIGQERVEPLEALRKAGQEGVVDLDKIAQNRKNADNLKRKRKEMKKCLHEQRRKQRKQLKQGGTNNK